MGYQYDYDAVPASPPTGFYGTNTWLCGKLTHDKVTYPSQAGSATVERFFATEAAFRAVILVFNLLSEFQRAAGLADYRRPATLRSLVFIAGGILGRTGQRTVLFLSRSWGGLQQRIALFNKMLEYGFPTSPKLAPGPPT